MTTTPPPSYDWVRTVKPELKKLDSIPLTGAAPPFPWDELSARLAHSFKRTELMIQPGEIIWRTKEELYTGLGETLLPLVFSIPSLRGTICWVISEQEMVILEALLLTKEARPLRFQDPSLSASFRRFLALEVLYDLTQVSFDKALTPLLTNQTTVPNQDSLCWDISIRLEGQTLASRLIISPEFRHSWVDYFAKQQILSALTQQMAQVVDIVVHIEAGKTHLSLSEWTAVQLGDFIPLDSCSLDAKRLEGRVMLTINGKQIFRAKVKDGNIKILELPLYHEVHTPMAKKTEAEEDDDDLSDLDLTEEEEEEEEEGFENFDEEEDIFEDHDLFTEEELENEAETAEISPSAEIAKETTKTEEEEPSTQTSPILQRGPLTSAQIPVALVVELGQIQMTMDQLLKLEPGNLLELNVQPENGVDLTINGKIVAKGELIRIGETLGVRVLQLGN